MNTIKWTSADVKNLGIYFGNDKPGFKTFEEIVPKFTKRFNYWKQFSLSKLGKASVSEMFLASKLVYAIKFYPIPLPFQKRDPILNFSICKFSKQNEYNKSERNVESKDVGMT